MPLSDYLNTSNFTSDPANTIFTTFSNLFGNAWLLIPVSVLGAVIFVKNKDPATVGAYFLITGTLFASGNIFAGNPEMAFTYTVMVALAITSIIAGLLLGRK